MIDLEAATKAFEAKFAQVCVHNTGHLLETTSKPFVTTCLGWQRDGSSWGDLSGAERLIFTFFEYLKLQSPFDATSLHWREKPVAWFEDKKIGITARVAFT